MNNQDKKDFNKVLEGQLTAMVHSGAYYNEMKIEGSGYIMTIVIEKVDNIEEVELDE